MSVEQLHCPDCRTQVLVEDINIQQGLAKCRQCNGIFSFGNVQTQNPVALWKGQPVFQPEGIEVLKLLSELKFEISWRKSASGFLIFFSLFWNAMLIPFVLIAIFSGEYSVLLFLSLHLAVGIGFAWHTLATLFNTTFIRVNRRELTIEHRPIRLPFSKDRYLEAQQIDQIFIEKYEQGKTNGRPVYAFRVSARMKSGSDQLLMKGLTNLDHAAYLENEIEQYLGISDRPVQEEWKG